MFKTNFRKKLAKLYNWDLNDFLSFLMILFIFAIVFCFFFVSQKRINALNNERNVELALCQLTPPKPVVLEIEKIVKVKEKPKPIVLAGSDPDIDKIIEEVCKKYKNVDPDVIKAIVYFESRYNQNTQNGEHVGLMQVSTYWHQNRAEKLGVSDFYDPRSNIMIGVDLYSDLRKKYNDTLALMCYNMGEGNALSYYNSNGASSYAQMVIERANEMKGV